MKKIALSQEHNRIIFDEYETLGPVILGPYCSYTWRRDPKHVLFTLARYKFCAKMLSGKTKVMDIGCGDAIGIPILLQSVKNVCAIDLEEAIIQSNIERYQNDKRLSFRQLDLTKDYINEKFDAAISLDVLEHIPQKKENVFLNNICRSLKSDAICIIGTPNLAANCHASKNSADGHINLKTHETLSESLSRFFENVLIFSMNDEVVHTGFYPMAHYLLGVGVGLKKRT